MSDYEMEPFETVQMLGRWPVVLPAYRVRHCEVQPNWEEGRLLSMHAHLEPGMVLYDVGAEHGDLSALYARWVQHAIQWEGDTRTQGGVVLVEGSDRFWPVIRATFEANGLVPVGCYAGFASDHDTPEEMRTPSWPTSTKAFRGEWPSWADGPAQAHHGFKSVVESQDTIPNIRFDTLAQWFGPPDAMTIDVEGAELLVLRGSERILTENRPLVWVSVHPTLIAHDYPESGVLGTGAPDQERQRVLDYMTDLSYAYIHIESNHEEHWLFYPVEIGQGFDEASTFDPWAGIEHLRAGSRTP